MAVLSDHDLPGATATRDLAVGSLDPLLVESSAPRYGLLTSVVVSAIG